MSTRQPEPFGLGASRQQQVQEAEEKSGKKAQHKCISKSHAVSRICTLRLCNTLNSLQDYNPNMHEVLELVLSSASCTTDAALLCKATTLSTYHKQLALAHVKEHLPDILVNAIKQAADASAGCPTQASRLIWVV